LLKAHVSRTGRLIDCSRLSIVSSELPLQILCSVIENGPPVDIDLSSPTANGLPPTPLFSQNDPTAKQGDIERECDLIYGALDKRISRHAEVAKRETGVHALWLGYPLLYVATTVEDRKQHILSPVFLWPVSVQSDFRREKHIQVTRLKEAKEAIDPVFNLAMVAWVKRQCGFDIRVPDKEQMQELDQEAVNALVQELANQFSPPLSIDLGPSLSQVPSAKQLDASIVDFCTF